MPQLPSVPCEKCRGTGRRPLSRELEGTLLSVQNGRDTVEKIYAKDPDRHRIGTAAVNKRLGVLMSLGLVARVPRGKTFIYTATSKWRRPTPTTKRKS